MLEITIGYCHNPLEEYSVKIYEINPYFYEHYEKKIGVNLFIFSSKN